MESTGRTKQAEHVTGTGMAQLAIDRHAASATRPAVTAPASTSQEGIMVERKVFVFSDAILGIGDTIESALAETNSYSGPDDVLTEADLYEYRGRRNAQSDRIYWASVEVTPEDWATIGRDPQGVAVFDIIERPFAEAGR